MDENQLNNQESQIPEESPMPPENNAKSYWSAIWEFLKIVIIAALIVLPIRYFLFQPFIVKGESMIPYLQSGDYLIIDEISYRFTNPARGDIVVLKFPLDERQRFIKRVIGVPGERVVVNNGTVTIYHDDQVLLLQESYLPAYLKTDGVVDVTLKDNEYFVMGDNRQFSYDSRRWGALPEDDIIGKAIFRVFPVTAMSLINHPAY